MRKNLFFILLNIFILSCGGPKFDEQAIKPPSTNEEAIQVYQEGLNGMMEGNFLYASKKFSEAESMLPQIEWASKSAREPAKVWMVPSFLISRIWVLLATTRVSFGLQTRPCG